MSTQNTLINITAVLILAAGSAAAYTGYNYLKGAEQDAFTLKLSYALQNSISQAVLLSERTASDSFYSSELETLESTIERAFSSLRNGDPAHGIPAASPAIQSHVDALSSIWDEITPSISQLVSRRGGDTDQYNRSVTEADKTAQVTLEAARTALLKLDNGRSSSDVVRKLKGAIANLEDGTALLNTGRSVPLDNIPAITGVFSKYVADLTAIGSNIAKEDAALPLLIRSYQGAQAVQVSLKRAADSSNGVAQNIPHAKSVWAARDRLNASTKGLIASAEAAPEARPYGITVVAGLTIATILLAIGSMLLMRSITTSRTAQVESKGRTLESSTRNKSKEMTTLLSEIGQIGEGNLNTVITESNESTREIAIELNRMVRAFRKILDDVSLTMTGLAAATEQAVITDRTVTTNRTEQEEAITHISKLVNDLLSFIRQIESMTASTEQTSEEMLSEVHNGEKAVTLVHENIITLQQLIQGIHHRSKHLIESFQTLENICEVMRVIASKSAMVSYQAELIAQRVDDKAVAKTITTSAAQMQRLTAETKEGVTQIAVVLKVMNDAAHDTQRSVVEAQGEMEQLHERSTIAQSALLGISDKTKHLSTSVEQVIAGTRSMKEQSAEVDNTMSAIIHYTTSNSAASEQTAGAIKAVNHQAQDVMKLIGNFRREQ